MLELSEVTAIGMINIPLKGPMAIFQCHRSFY